MPRVQAVDRHDVVARLEKLPHHAFAVAGQMADPQIGFDPLRHGPIRRRGDQRSRRQSGQIDTGAVGNGASGPKHRRKASQNETTPQNEAVAQHVTIKQVGSLCCSACRALRRGSVVAKHRRGRGENGAHRQTKTAYTKCSWVSRSNASSIALPAPIMGPRVRVQSPHRATTRHRRATAPIYRGRARPNPCRAAFCRQQSCAPRVRPSARRA